MIQREQIKTCEAGVWCKIGRSGADVFAQCYILVVVHATIGLSSLKRSGMARVNSDQTVVPATHVFIHKLK